MTQELGDVLQNSCFCFCINDLEVLAANLQGYLLYRVTAD